MVSPESPDKASLRNRPWGRTPASEDCIPTDAERVALNKRSKVYVDGLEREMGKLGLEIPEDLGDEHGPLFPSRRVHLRGTYPDIPMTIPEDYYLDLGNSPPETTPDA